MSLYTNLMVSYFPESFKFNYEEGSNGFKLYNSVAGFLENSYYENRVFRNYKKFSNPVKQVSFLNKINLSYKDFSSNEFGYFLEPAVFKDSKRLKYIPSFKDFLNRNPEAWILKKEIKVNDWLIWESSSDFYNDIYEDENLMVDFSGISSFVSQFQDEESVIKRLSHHNEYGLVIKGRDKFFNKIEESLVVFNREPVVTSLRFKRLEEIDFDGFEGDIKIYLTSRKSPNYKKEVVLDKFTSSGIDLTNLKLSLEEDSGYCFLKFEKAIQLIDIFDKTLSSSEKTEHIVDCLFLDENLKEIKIIDFAINKQNYDLYCLSDENNIHVYEIDLHDMKGPSEPYNRNSFLSFYREINRCGYLEEHDIGAIFLNRRAKVKSFSIKRISPSGVTEWYDQGSWTSSKTTQSLNTDIWKNSDTYSFDFENYFDEYGEWEFYLEAEYEEFPVQVIATTVFCEYMKPKKSYSFENSEKFDGIFFNKDKALCLSLANSYMVYDQFHDTFSYSPLLEELVTRDRTDVEVIMPFHLVSKKESNTYTFYANGKATDKINLKINERHCLLQVEKSKNKDKLFVSKEAERDLAVNSKINLEYYIDGEKKTVLDYIAACDNSNYEKIELFFNLKEKLFVYCENDKHLKLEIDAVDIDSLPRIT